MVNVPRSFQRERIVEQRLIDAIRERAPRNIGDFFLSLGKDAGDLLRVDLEMFKEGLRKMGVIMAPQDVEKVFAACDRNGDGQLDVEEFAANFVKHGQTKERRLLAMSDVAHHAPGRRFSSPRGRKGVDAAAARAQRFAEADVETAWARRDLRDQRGAEDFMDAGYGYKPGDKHWRAIITPSVATRRGGYSHDELSLWKRQQLRLDNARRHFDTDAHWKVTSIDEEMAFEHGHSNEMARYEKKYMPAITAQARAKKGHGGTSSTMGAARYRTLSPNAPEHCECTAACHTLL